MKVETENFRSVPALLRLLVTMVVGVGADLYTKWWAFGVLGRSAETHVCRFWPGWVHFEVTTNHGAVFGLGAGQRWLFLGVSGLAIVFLLYLFATSRRQRFYQVVLGMLLAGVLGNMYDRMVFGYVRDMIHGLPGWKWPGSSTEVFPWIFNVADVLLCVGVGLMVVYSVFGPKVEGEASEVSGDGRGVAGKV